VGGQTGLGFLSQERSIPAGFVVGGLATFVALPLFGRLRALEEPADRITAEAPEARLPGSLELAEAEAQTIDPLGTGSGP
jgi:hypothetical protein